MAYATEADLAEYLGVSEADLPTDAGRLLERASEAVDYITRGKIDPENAEHSEAAKKATCAQVELWLQTEGIGELPGTIKSFSLGKFSMDFGEAGMPDVASRAKQYLFLAGLLYRGVCVR